MSQYLRSVMVQIEYPNSLTNSTDTNPTGPGLTTPLTEVSNILFDGCGSDYVYERYEDRRGDFDAVYVIKEA